MRLHLFHLSPHGLIRAFSQMRAGYALCRQAGVRFLDYVPSSVNSMTAAWNFKLTVEECELPSPQSIIDIGANVSQMTKLLKLACRSEPVIQSFEPHPKLTPIGKKFELALSDRDGEAEFAIPAGDNDWGTIKPRPGETANSFKVKMARFDTLVSNGVVRWSDLPRPILVKIDTEGSELDALRGFGEKLREVDYLVIEVENREFRGGNYSMIDLCAYLEKFGFTRSKVLYACYDGPVSPAYLDTLFWRA